MHFLYRYVYISSILLLCLIKLVSLSAVSQASSGHCTCILRIQFPSSVIAAPTLLGYYKGYKLDFSGDTAIIYEQKLRTKFIIIITEQIHYRHTSAQGYLERDSAHPCRLFYLTASPIPVDADQPALYTWTIEEEDAENIPLRIPPAALVLLMDPRHIDTLKATETPIHSHLITVLPTVLVKATISDKELHAAATRILLASLELPNIHTHIKKAVKQEQSTLISVPTI